MLWHRILSVVGWLGWGFCGYAICLFAWTLWKHKRPKHAESLMKWTENWRFFKERGSTQIEKVWVSGVVMLASVFFIFAASRPPKYPIATEHNVIVYGQLVDGDWSMYSDEEGDFAYRPCPDFDASGMLKQGIGYIAPVAKWEERGDCKSIRATGLGFKWRDKNKEYREAD